MSAHDQRGIHAATPPRPRPRVRLRPILFPHRGRDRRDVVPSAWICGTLPLVSHPGAELKGVPHENFDLADLEAERPGTTAPGCSLLCHRRLAPKPSGQAANRQNLTRCSSKAMSLLRTLRPNRAPRRPLRSSLRGEEENIIAVSLAPRAVAGIDSFGNRWNGIGEEAPRLHDCEHNVTTRRTTTTTTIPFRSTQHYRPE